MNRVGGVWILCVASAGSVFAQGHPVDWPLYGGDGQRSGWEKSDSRITRDNVKDFRLVLKQKLDQKGKGARSLSAPVVIGTLISYRGFKELAFVSGSGDKFWALDADLERMFWQKQLETTGKGQKGACSGASTPALIPPANFSARRTPPPAVGSTKSPGPPATPAGAPGVNPRGAVPGILSAGGFGAPRPVFALASDGKLHFLNTSTGEDMGAPMQFTPAGARASSLTFSDGFLYTTTTGHCGGVPDAVWAIDLSGAGAADAPAAVQFAPAGGGLPELGGLAIGADGSVYTRAGDGSVFALTAKDLKLSGTFQPPSGTAQKSSAGVATPVAFTFKERDLIVSTSNDGRLVLLDAKALGAPLFQSAPIAGTGSGIWGGLSSWEDPDGTRWIYAPVWGQVSAKLSALAATGIPAHGALIAFKVEERDGKPVLTPAWVSEDMLAPEPPAITGGMVFVLAAGNYKRDERLGGASHATLYALDAVTGKELYSTQEQVTAPADLTGVTLANGRVYFTTVDSTLWAFGVYLER